MGAALSLVACGSVGGVCTVHSGYGGRCRQACLPLLLWVLLVLVLVLLVVLVVVVVVVVGCWLLLWLLLLVPCCCCWLLVVVVVVVVGFLLLLVAGCWLLVVVVAVVVGGCYWLLLVAGCCLFWLAALTSPFFVFCFFVLALSQKRLLLETAFLHRAAGALRSAPSMATDVLRELLTCPASVLLSAGEKALKGMLPKVKRWRFFLLHFGWLICTAGFVGWWVGLDRLFVLFRSLFG